VRLDLVDEVSEQHDQQNVNINKLYAKAYKMLKKDLKKQGLIPCVIYDLRHAIFMLKESDQAYIFFQMTILETRAK